MHPEVLLLGLLAGGTIVLGLPVARLRTLTTKTKGFLNAVSTGILIFLLVEISGHLVEEIEEMVEEAIEHGRAMTEAWQYGGLCALGFGLGLLGLVWFEQRYLRTAHEGTPPKTRAKQVAMMIAIGLGLHNLSEGLAIGQGYASGAMRLAWLLAIGFALHNATEGFGIAAPLSGHRVSWRFLALTGFIAGGPTFLGALIGGTWVNKPMEMFCLALASGTILYVVGELMHLGRQLKEDAVVGVGLLTGFIVAVAAEFVLVAGSVQVAHAPAALQAGEAAQEQAAHRPRHGGYFGDADDLYHYELVRISANELHLYVNDERNEPMEVTPLRGRWTLNADTPSAVTGPFHPDDHGAYFSATLPHLDSADAVQITVEVLKGRRWVPLEFTLPPLATSSS